MRILEAYIQEIIAEQQLNEQEGQSISELIEKVPMKALVKVLKKGLGNLKSSAKMGIYYAKNDNFKKLTQYFAEKLKGESQKFKSEEEVIKYIDDNADKLIELGVAHYNENHPDDEPIKLEFKKNLGDVLS